ncbi:MAG TPA: hypothetical protein VE993_22100 [Stellaceae bacterium]|nr:hypothetical protein [Stellaceae bacterium]
MTPRNLKRGAGSAERSENQRGAGLARVHTILDRLAPDELAVLAPLLPAWLIRQRRYAARDAAIVAALAHFSGERCVAAKRLAWALAGYQLSNWRAERHQARLPEGAAGRHRALHAILRACGGKTLGWRRIADIVAHSLQQEPPAAATGPCYAGADEEPVATPGRPCGPDPDPGESGLWRAAR